MSQLTEFFNRVEPEFITSDLPTALVITGTYSLSDLNYVLSYAQQSDNLKHLVFVSNDYAIAQVVPQLARQYPTLHFSYLPQQSSSMAQAQLTAQRIGKQAGLSAELIAVCEYLLQAVSVDSQFAELLTHAELSTTDVEKLLAGAVARLSASQHHQFQELSGIDYLEALQASLQLTKPLVPSSTLNDADTLAQPADAKACTAAVVVNHLCFYPKTKDELLEILQQWQLATSVSVSNEHSENSQVHAWLQAVAQLAQVEGEQISTGYTFLVGANDSGIKTLAKFTAPAAYQLYNSNRVRLFSLGEGEFALTAQALQKSKLSFYTLGAELRNLELKKPVVKHFAPLAESSWDKTTNTELARLLERLSQVQIFSSKGIFSPEHLDTGTQVLLKTYLDFELAVNKQFIASLSNGEQVLNLLDYGCGSGVISSFLDLLLQEFYSNTAANSAFDSDREQVGRDTSRWCWNLFDVSRAALNSARYNLQLCQGKTKFLWGTSLTNYQDLELLEANRELNSTQTSSGKYQHIIANPPFHTGNQQTFSIVENLIAHAAEQLVPQGTLRMVANEGLPYLPMLKKHFKQVSELAREAGFVVYLASK